MSVTPIPPKSQMIVQFQTCPGMNILFMISQWTKIVANVAVQMSFTLKRVALKTRIGLKFLSLPQGQKNPFFQMSMQLRQVSLPLRNQQEGKFFQIRDENLMPKQFLQVCSRCLVRKVEAFVNRKTVGHSQVYFWQCISKTHSFFCVNISHVQSVRSRKIGFPSYLTMIFLPFLGRQSVTVREEQVGSLIKRKVTISCL